MPERGNITEFLFSSNAKWKNDRSKQIFIVYCHAESVPPFPTVMLSRIPNVPWESKNQKRANILEISEA